MGTVALTATLDELKPKFESATGHKLFVYSVIAALLAGKSVVYADPAKGGASGVHFAKVLEKLGIADEMKPKTTLVPGAQAAEVVFRGEAEFGVAMASEIVPIKGAQLVGPLPKTLGMVLQFSGGVGPKSQDPAAASALVQFIRSPAGADALRSNGMDPS